MVFFNKAVPGTCEIFVSVPGCVPNETETFSFDINTSYLRPVTGFPVHGAAWRDHTASAFSDGQSLIVTLHFNKSVASCVTGRWVEGLGERTSRTCLQPPPAWLGGGPTPLSQVTASFWGRYLHGAHWSRFPCYVTNT